MPSSGLSEAETKVALTCNPHITERPVTPDARGKYLGNLFQTPVYGDNIHQWATEILQASFPDAPQGNADYTATFSFGRATLSNALAKLVGDAVINGDYSFPDGASRRIAYRGIDSDINWASDKSEMTLVLEKALGTRCSKLSLTCKDLVMTGK